MEISVWGAERVKFLRCARGGLTGGLHQCQPAPGAHDTSPRIPMHELAWYLCPRQSPSIPSLVGRDYRATADKMRLFAKVGEASKYLALVGICVLAFSIRLFSVVKYESVIHEFDPYFNYRVTQFLTKEGFYEMWNWFDDRTWYPLGRVIGGTVYPVRRKRARRAGSLPSAPDKTTTETGAMLT